MKILVGNSKGGVGKSTTAVQIVAPYLYAKFDNQPVTLIEVDRANKDSETFEASSILKAFQLDQHNPELGANLTDAIIENENLIIDIAGGETSLDVLEILVSTGMLGNFDMLIIPLMDGEQDATNAIRTYKKLRELNKDIKTIFALSKVDETMSLELQFFDFFGDTKSRINDAKGMIEQVAKEDKNIIKVHSSDTIKYSRIFGNTVYEIAQNDTTTIKAEMAESMENKDDELTRKLSYKMGILSKAKKYLENTIKPCFEVLN